MWEPEPDEEKNGLTEPPAADVLVIDDDPCTRIWAEALLRAGGCRVASVTCGRAALAWLKRHPRPKVVLLDPEIPGMHGQEVARQIRSDPALADLPIILYTSAADVDRQTAAKYATCCLRKPASKERLLQAVRDFGVDGGHRRAAQPPRPKRARA
jgi:CheY-like chemotaxis protein